MKFLVYEHYDVDGGIGDAIPQMSLRGILDVESEEQAKEWAKKHTHDRIYDVPYADLHEGLIELVCLDTLPQFTIDDCPWSEKELKHLTDPRTNREIEEDEYYESMAADMEAQARAEEAMQAAMEEEYNRAMAKELKEFQEATKDDC